MQQADTRPCSFRHSFNSAFELTSPPPPAWTQTPVPFGKPTPAAAVCSRTRNGVCKVSASIPFSKTLSSSATSGPAMHMNDAAQFHAGYRIATLPATLSRVSVIAEHHQHHHRPDLAASQAAADQFNPGSKQQTEQMLPHPRSRLVGVVATDPVACSTVSSSPAATEAAASGHWQCDVCGKRFALSSVLKSHRHIHSGVRPHVCEVCKKHFLRSGDLKKHRRFEASTTSICILLSSRKVPHR